MKKEERPKVNCRVIIEMLGAPKEHLEETIRMYVSKMKEEDKNIKVLREHFEPAAKKDKMYSTFAELDLEVSGPENLVWFCFDYMPSSVEIFEPEEIVYRMKDFTDFINDMQGKLHRVDMALKNITAENQILKKNTGVAITNLVKLSLKSGPQSAEKIAKQAGMLEDAMKKFLAKLEEEKVVEKKDELYSLCA
jgi:hypothetical protein